MQQPLPRAHMRFDFMRLVAEHPRPLCGVDHRARFEIPVPDAFLGAGKGQPQALLAFAEGGLGPLARRDVARHRGEVGRHHDPCLGGIHERREALESAALPAVHEQGVPEAAGREHAIQGPRLELERPVLLAHGEKDTRVPFSHFKSMRDAAARALEAWISSG